MAHFIKTMRLVSNMCLKHSVPFGWLQFNCQSMMINNPYILYYPEKEGSGTCPGFPPWFVSSRYYVFKKKKTYGQKYLDVEPSHPQDWFLSKLTPKIPRHVVKPPVAVALRFYFTWTKRLKLVPAWWRPCARSELHQEDIVRQSRSGRTRASSTGHFE